MKKFIKRTSSALVASALSLSVVSAFSAAAASNQPRIYATLSYVDEQTSKVNIMFENFPEIRSGSFHVQLGDGFKVKKHPVVDDILTDTTNLTSEYMNVYYMDYAEKNMVFITAISSGITVDPDGRFASFYVEKTDVNTSENSTADVVFMPTGIDNITDTKANKIFGDSIETPIMLKSDEYLVGDTTNDGLVNAEDASDILSAIHKNYNINVSINCPDSIFLRLFPDAKTKETPDTTKDSMISEEDAYDIMDYYSSMSTSQPYNGYAGTIDVYEYYQN